MIPRLQRIRSRHLETHRKLPRTIDGLLNLGIMGIPLHLKIENIGLGLA